MTQHYVSSGATLHTLPHVETETRTLGNYVRQRREAMGKTLTALAADADLSKSELSALERGRINLPGADKRRRLAAALGVSHVDLLVAAGELNTDEVTASPVPFDAVTATVLQKTTRWPPEMKTILWRIIDGMNEAMGQQSLPLPRSVTTGRACRNRATTATAGLCRSRANWTPCSAGAIRTTRNCSPTSPTWTRAARASPARASMRS